MIKAAFLGMGLALLSSSAIAETDMWVTSDRLNRRTCPDTDCGSVGSLMFREKATVFEERSGWARITKYYDAYCENGQSRYVDKGNVNCTELNGIVDGQFAEWVSAKYLSATRPEDPAAEAEGDYLLISGSDDYRLYKDIFAQSAMQLIASGTCSESDFKEMGGWWKAPHPKGKTVYFTYCGGMNISNKLYLDVSNGKIFK